MQSQCALKANEGRSLSTCYPDLDKCDFHWPTCTAISAKCSKTKLKTKFKVDSEGNVRTVPVLEVGIPLKWPPKWPPWK